MDSSEHNIIVNDSTDDVTIKLDSTELERTMRLSDEELTKAFVQANKAPHQKTEFFGNTTAFFSLNKTSSFSSIFEKKRDVEDDLAKEKEQTSIASESIDNFEEDAIPLHNIEDSFEIINKIGEGGQGIISTAADRSLGRIVALKSLHTNLNEQNPSRDHFVAEAKITAQLDYPGIVPIYSLNKDNEGGLHLAMKFINGENLADYLERIREQYKKDGIEKFNEGSSMRKRIEILLRSCDAMIYAHDRNVMHCDLKPENIMLGQHNDSYIMDWGIARLIKDPSYDPATWVRPSSISGTPRYLAPEAIDGIYTDERVDVYALGLILFECVFLKSAYNGTNTKEVISRVRNGEIESFRHEFGFRVSKDLRAIIAKAVAHNRDERYQSVSEFTEDIRRYLNNEETLARPDNMFAAILRFSQRHIKMMLIFALTGLLLAGGSISYSVYQKSKHNNFILRREVALSEAYSKALYVANLIELQMNHVSSSLKILSAYISFLLEQKNVSAPDGMKYFLISEEKNNAGNAADIRFSVPCNKYISLDRIGFNAPGGKYSQDMLSRINRLQNLQMVLRNALLYGDIFRERSLVERLDEKEAEQYYFVNGSPILWFYCGFNDGLYFSMPGYTEQSAKYDPRTRPWYIAAANRTPFDDVVWGTPYVDAVSQRLTLSASLPIFVDKKQCGVIAIDNMLQYISRFMKKNGNTDGFLLEKILIDENGKILLSTRKDYSVKDAAKVEENVKEKKSSVSSDVLKFFEEKSVFPKIKIRKNGTLTVRTENGRNIIYLFYCINTHNWYYVEKIDIDMLIDHIESEKKSDAVEM